MRRGAVILLVAGQSVAASAFADGIQRAGDVGAIALPLSAVAATAVVKDGRGIRQLAEAYASTMAVVLVLKPTIDRRRPDGGRHSFPSGHTASAFAGAAFLQRRYGWAYGVPAYAAASFVGYSRVEARRHYTSDVVAGGALGIAANVLFTRHRERMALAAGGGRFALVVTW